MGPLILPTRGPVYLDANGFIYSNDTDFRRVEDLPWSFWTTSSQVNVEHLPRAKSKGYLNLFDETLT